MPKFLEQRIEWLVLWLLCCASLAIGLYVRQWPPPPSGLGRGREAVITLTILLMATAGFYYRWGSVLFWANVGALLGDSPAAASGASKLEVTLGMMFWGFWLGLVIAALHRLARPTPSEQEPGGEELPPYREPNVF